MVTIGLDVRSFNAMVMKFEPWEALLQIGHSGHSGHSLFCSLHVASDCRKTAVGSRARTLKQAEARTITTSAMLGVAHSLAVVHGIGRSGVWPDRRFLTLIWKRATRPTLAFLCRE